MAGYSSTPLAKKLGIKSGINLRLINAPSNYRDMFTDFPSEVCLDAAGVQDIIHYFETTAEKLERTLQALRKDLKPNGAVWVSWYKKAAKMPCDVTEDLIRTVALRNGLVDVKVCAVDEQWSGLKLVIPVRDRK